MNATTKKSTALAAMIMISLSACGSSSKSDAAGDGYGTPGTAAVAAAPATAAAPAVAPAAGATPADTTPAGNSLISVSENALGSIMVDADGLTLYAFTKDSKGASSCVDGCAAAWPPVIVDANLDLSTLPSTGAFSIIDRADGTKQLQAGDFPLYRFAGDAKPGETNGQGSGDSWFVVAPDATLVK